MVDSTHPAVLLVENEPELRKLYVQWLDDDYEVRTAVTGDTALEQVDDTINIILINRGLPTISGMETLETLRERGYRCPVAMVTGFDPPETPPGDSPLYDAYCVKPVFRDAFRHLVAGLARLPDRGHRS